MTAYLSANAKNPQNTQMSDYVGHFKVLQSTPSQGPELFCNLSFFPPESQSLRVYFLFPFLEKGAPTVEKTSCYSQELVREFPPSLKWTKKACGHCWNTRALLHEFSPFIFYTCEFSPACSSLGCLHRTASFWPINTLFTVGIQCFLIPC